MSCAAARQTCSQRAPPPPSVSPQHSTCAAANADTQTYAHAVTDLQAEAGTKKKAVLHASVRDAEDVHTQTHNTHRDRQADTGNQTHTHTHTDTDTHSRQERTRFGRLKRRMTAFSTFGSRFFVFLGTGRGRSETFCLRRMEREFRPVACTTDCWRPRL